MLDKDYIVRSFKDVNIKISERQGKLFFDYMEFLLQENEKYNLTAITDPREIVVKHFIDSCVAVNFIKGNYNLIDIGAGAGFPGIPLAILLPESSFVLIDSLRKRVDFLNNLINTLKLTNCKAVWARSEDLAMQSEYREKFDYCIARAVAKTNTLCEYCLPFVKIGGQMIAYKSKDAEKEVIEAQNAIKILGGQIKEIKQFNIYGMDRRLIIIEKRVVTDKKYPRKQNKAKLNPL